jgi:von Willebrand factor type A domain
MGKTLGIAITVLAAACGGSDEREQQSATNVGSLSGASSLGETTVGDASGTETTPPLDSSGGEPCSIDGDCPDGQHCGTASGMCVPPDGCVLPDDCDGGFTCEDGTCTIGGCGGFQFMLEVVPPNVMILLDRSGSMDGDVPDSNDNRWEVAVAVIQTVTTAFDDDIRFGLATYSSCESGGCSPGSIVVPLLPSNAANIQTFLATTKGEGSSDGMQVDGDGLVRYLCDSGDPETSTGVSLAELVGETTLLDPERQNAVLLITDGGESGECTDEVDGPGGATMLFAQDPSVLTFAVGMGDASSPQLDEIATAGGTMISYLALDPVALQMALESVLQTITSCTFSLDQVPEDAAEIFVFFDKLVPGVANDDVDGWTYDPVTNSVTFHGASCEQIKSGAVVDVDIVYGCNMPPVG